MKTNGKDLLVLFFLLGVVLPFMAFFLGIYVILIGIGYYFPTLADFFNFAYKPAAPRFLGLGIIPLGAITSFGSFKACETYFKCLKEYKGLKFQGGK